MLLVKYWIGFWGSLSTEHGWGIFRLQSLSGGLRNNIYEGDTPFSLLIPHPFASPFPCFSSLFASSVSELACPNPFRIALSSFQRINVRTMFDVNCIIKGFMPGFICEGLIPPFWQLTDPSQVFPSLFPYVCIWKHRSILLLSCWSGAVAALYAQSQGPPQNNSFDALISDNGPSKV